MELHVRAQRLQANKRAAAERGELRTPLPVGYVHDDPLDVVIDPDAGVQAAIRDVFAAFAAFAGRRFPLRAYVVVSLVLGLLVRVGTRQRVGELADAGCPGAYDLRRHASHSTQG